MRINGLAEYSSLGKVEWIPIVSSFVGLGRLIYNLLSSLDPKTKDEIELNSLKGRIHFWSEEKRGTVALIPIIGNALLIWHDCSITKRLDELERNLKKAITDQDIEAIFKKFPEEIRKSETRMLDLIKINPKILQYSPFKTNRSFMQKAAVQNIDHLKYATELMKDQTFVFNTAEHLTRLYEHDLIRYYERFEGDLTTLTIPFFKGSRYIYNDGQMFFSYNTQPNAQGSYEILKYAQDLCKDTNFLLKASREYPYLNPAKYAQGNADNQKFILDMMRVYKDPSVKKILYFAYRANPFFRKEPHNSAMGAWLCVEKKIYSIVEEKPLTHLDKAPTIPLKEIASVELKNNQEFMKSAIRIDKKSIEFASEELKPVLQAWIEAGMP